MYVDRNVVMYKGNANAKMQPSPGAITLGQPCTAAASPRLGRQLLDWPGLALGPRCPTRVSECLPGATADAEMCPYVQEPAGTAQWRAGSS